MRFEGTEYIVSKAGVPDESITITKKALEEWRDHYIKEAAENKYTWLYAAGKADALIDILKHFDEKNRPALHSGDRKKL